MRPAAARPASCARRAAPRPVTVVDIDEDQIRNNDYAQQTILGDVQSYRSRRQFRPRDLLQCHRASGDTGAALLRFCESLKQGGLMLIGAPNPRSLSGVVTNTRRMFHVWFYRIYAAKEKRSGGSSAVPDLLPPAGHAFESRSLRHAKGSR